MPGGERMLAVSRKWDAASGRLWGQHHRAYPVPRRARLGQFPAFAAELGKAAGMAPRSSRTVPALQAWSG